MSLAASIFFSRRSAAFAVVLICIVVTIEAARLGLSGLISDLAQSELDRWTAPGKPRAAAELDRVAGYFSDSLRYVSDNPWALEGLGALDLARVRVSKDPKKALALANDARDRYTEALRVRPTSPYLWANLALSKIYLDQIDPEFLSALTNADRLAPWEPGAQQTVVFAGLAAWEKLDAAHRRMIELAIERGSRRNAEKMYAIVKTYRRWELVCPLSGYHRVAAADCQKAAEPAKAPPPLPKGKR